eukprot:CAMPEP_0172308176 /NCGR_PEP_ID=MMETSP1058-20130122/8858_1 /TAXON_ID=83371 /ORGANISM="Detonula confervacea, Strain CCMP 353" /LENGTH=934 /DNA_ID=CAMNT_0013020539 /DNA_START=24 /DNA_END=2828 /DNA_ORIENTATION=-
MNSWAVLFAIVMTTQLLSVVAFLPPTSYQILSKPLVGGQKCDVDNRGIKSTHLMGIKGFRSWFESTFPSAVVTIRPPLPDRYNKNTGKNSGSSTNFQPETFDHVLIDANQFLHTTLRKAYNRRAKRPKGSDPAAAQQLDDDIIEHSLLLFLKEINRITTTTAIPRKSLVIALDGSPGAAKLEMQRRRRFSIYKKAESQERQMEVLRERGWRDNDFGFFNNRAKKKKPNPILSKHERERVTLNITPGTAFMKKVTDALLYWSWQHVTRFPRVRVYISPSYVHGEGEVKLLDWILHGHDLSISSPKSHRTNVKQNETIAILGGDSDLVLMGLVVPPSITHNIHVILPGEKGKSLVASVWETTRSMARMIEGTATYGIKATGKSKGKKRKRTLSLSQINQARIDTTLLIIMNGNDYLPKLRGCRTGFDSFFKEYLNLVKEWMDNDSGDAFLINFDENNELYLNVPFALSFFQALASNSQTTSYEEMSYNIEDSSSLLQSRMGTLINLVQAKILPGPIDFDTISPESSFFDQELFAMNSKLNQNTTDVINNVFADGAEIVRLTLGDFQDDDVASSNTATMNATSSQEIFTNVIGGESDGHGVISRMMRNEEGRSYIFEVPHRQQYSSLKAAKDRLSCLALEEIFGRDNVDALFGSSASDETRNRVETKDNSSLSEKPQGLAQADAASYLGGLLWNLETYQHGCCADYGFNYGRASPSPYELVSFLENLKMQGKLKIKCHDLITRTNSAPLSDGLSCLAAVPPQAWHIVPEPYSWLVEPSRSKNFEDLYNSCIHSETNAFDIVKFEKECNSKLSQIRSQQNAMPSGIDVAAEDKGAVPSGQNDSKGRRIYAGSKFWTVISRSSAPLTHPFEPPEPFTERMPRLRRNKRIKASKLPVKARTESPKETEYEKSEVRENKQRIQGSVHEIPFETAFNNHDSN